jgi:photosystem II stability/assembly factor-like uncharacterized protein
MLGSLTSVPGVAAKPEIDPGALQPGEGMVMMRIIATRDVAMNTQKWQRLRLREVQTRESYTLANVFFGRTTSSYFRQSLPAGDYELSNVESGTSGGPASFEASARFPDGFRFSVIAGRLTDLGTLFYVRPYSPADTSRFDWIYAADTDFARHTKYLLAAGEAESLLFAPLGWTTIPRGSDRSRLDERMKRMSMALAGRASTADGGLMFGELFGQVVRRSRDGNWIWEETGAAETIAAAVEGTDEKWWAVAENSTLLRRDAPGKWQRVEVPIANATPCFVSPEIDGALTTIWETRTSIVMFNYQPKDKSPWTERRRIESANSWLGAGVGYCSVLPSIPYFTIVTSVLGFTSPKYTFDVFNRTTGEWQRYPQIKVYGAVGTFTDGSIYAIAGPNAKQKFRVSRDFGKTWETRSSLRWSGLPGFRNVNDGFLLHTDHIPLFKAENFGLSLWLTSDGGKRWKPFAAMPSGLIAAAIPLEEQGMMFVTSTGQMFVSPDNGKTFVMERDSSAETW